MKKVVDVFSKIVYCVCNVDGTTHRFALKVILAEIFVSEFSDLYES